MPYRTILIHTDCGPNSAARIELAAELALRQDAHLVGTAMTGVPRYMRAGGLFEGSGVMVGDYLKYAGQRATEALAQFEDIAGRLGVASREQRRIDDDAYAGLCLQSRYADLLVLGQADPARRDDSSLLQDLPDYMVINCGRPVLLVPRSGSFAGAGQHALVAWNGSLEAARAITAALPLLAAARQVTLALFGEYSGHGEEPGADMAGYLARHNVRVEVKCRPQSADAGHAILALASDIGADLLVMGAYGHSRFREMMLGGATRTILASSTLPVLLAH